MTQGPQKAKLRPSQDVLQRLRWDARFDAGSYLVVYRERGGGTKELPVPSFLESQRIPWSRVTAVLHRDRTLIWDRARRIDRLFGSGETPSEDLLVPGSDGGEGFGIALDPWSWSGEAWVHGASQAPPAAPRPLRVLTWNLLFDRFAPERIQTARRLPVQLRLLEESQADVIALQEVTPVFYAALLAEPWVRERYWASEGPAAATLDPSGQAILSRVPLEAVRVHAFSSRKQAVVATLRTSEGRLVVVNLHLTSNQAERAEQIRLEQLRLLTRLLQRAHPDDDWLVLGDFNQREGEPDGGLTRAGGRDLWPEVGEGPGKTYDPSSNSLADFFTQSERAARFDRIYLRSRSDRWRGTRAQLYATAPIPAAEPPLHPSDHFALLCELSPADGLAGEPVRDTALALVPPAALWGPLQAIRREHDDRITRWPPHLNLLFGFVPPERFPAALAQLGPRLRELPRVSLELGAVQRFTLKRETVYYAAPQPPAPLIELQAELRELFSGCGEERPFTPHLTLARLPRGSEDAARAAELADALGSSTWEPDGVALLAREGRGPYTIRAVLPWGPPRSLSESLEDTGLLLSPAAASAREALGERLTAACLAAGAQALEPVGSSALGVALRTSDLDFALRLPPAPTSSDDVWLEEFAPRLSAELGEVRWELVPAGQGQQLRLLLELEGEHLRVDLQPERGPSQAAAEAAAVLAAAGDDLGGFRLGLRALRVWARLRQFDRQAFGAFGGAAWAALAVSVWESLSEPGPEALVSATLERIAAGGADLGSGGAGHGSSASPTIFARSDPQHDLAASLRPSTWRALRREAQEALPLARAASAGEGAWSGLFLPCSPPPAPRVLLHLEHGPQDREAAAGWVASVAHELLRRLESGGAQPRAYPTPSEVHLEDRVEQTWAVGLRGALAAGAWERVATWLERAAKHAPPGARVSFDLE